VGKNPKQTALSENIQFFFHRDKKIIVYRNDENEALSGTEVYHLYAEKFLK
jgi:hypothetical protein